MLLTMLPTRFSAILALVLFSLLSSKAESACADGEYETEVGGCYLSWTGPLGEGFYTIAVPEGWTPSSGLVFWNHGVESYTQGLSNEEEKNRLIYMRYWYGKVARCGNAEIAKLAKRWLDRPAEMAPVFIPLEPSSHAKQLPNGRLTAPNGQLFGV